MHALTIKLFDDMKEIKKEKFALHCIVSIKSALHCIVSNFLHCTISLLLMFLGWKLDSYCFAGRDLAFWYLAYLVIQLQDEESQVFTSLLLYFVLFIAYLLVIQFVFYQIITSLCFFNSEVSMWMLYFSSIVSNDM